MGAGVVKKGTQSILYDARFTHKKYFWFYNLHAISLARTRLALPDPHISGLAEAHSGTTLFGIDFAKPYNR